MSKPINNKLKYSHRQDRIWHTKFYKDRKREERRNPTYFEESQYGWLRDIDEDYWD